MLSASKALYHIKFAVSWVSLTLAMSHLRVPVARLAQEWRSTMPTFIVTMNFTDQGIRTIKDGPKRAQAAREMAKKLGVEIKEVYLTSGEADLLAIVDTNNPDAV